MKKKAKLPFTKIQMILTEETFQEVESFYELFDDIVDDVTVNQYTERGGKLSSLSGKEKKITKNSYQNKSPFRNTLRQGYIRKLNIKKKETMRTTISKTSCDL